MKYLKNLKSVGIYFLLYAAVLIYLELVLRFHMNEGVKSSFLFFLCFIPTQALFLTVLNGFFNDRKNLIPSSVLLLLLEVYYLAQLIYYKNFGSLFSVSMAGMGAEAVGNFGWTLTGVIKSNIFGIFLILLPVFLIGILSFFRLIKQEKIGWKPRLILLVLTIPLWILGVQATRLDGDGLQSAYVIYHDTLTDTDTTASHLGAMTTSILELYSSHFEMTGSKKEVLATVNTDILKPAEPPVSSERPSVAPATDDPQSTAVEEDPLPEPEPYIYEDIDLAQLAESSKDQNIKELALFLEDRGVSTTNAYTGMFEGYNLIYICAESFWSYAVDENVTPTLYKMANNGIILNNYYNSFRNTTTNGEFAFSTSLWPDLSRQADCGTDAGSFPQSAKCFMPLGPGKLFRAAGIPAYAYHNYYGQYYRRYLSWPNLGYECKFSGRGMKFTSSWPASDVELMEQSVDDYILGDDPFLAYYMTFSGHGPYSSGNIMYRKNIDEVKEHAAEGYSDGAYGYLAGNLELDKAMEYLLTRLEEAGKLDNTVIVIAGDHFPYNLPMKSANELAGHELDEDFEIYHSACIIYNAGMEEPLVTDTYCSNVDILPTMLNLFGVDYDSRLLMGRDIFSDSIHKAVIYNKSFITDMVQYNRKTGDAVWTDRAAEYTDEMKEAYLDAMNQLIDSEFYASTQILSQNFYLEAWYQNGLLTEEELAAEKKRAANAEVENEKYNEHLRLKALEEAELAAELEAAAEAEAAAAEGGQENPAAEPGANPVAEPGVEPVVEPGAEPVVEPAPVTEN